MAINKILLPLSFCLLAFLFLFRPVIDLDLGWHLRYGQEMYQNHTVPRINTFSQQMEGEFWADHEWLYQLIIYPMYQTMYLPGLSLFGAIIVTTSIFLITLPFSKVRWVAGLVSLIALQPLLRFGLRSQYMSLLGISLLNYIFWHTKQKFHYILPFVFLFWANLHGSFVYGLALYAAFIVIKESNTTKLDIQKLITAIDSKLLLLSIVITIINPYGLKLHQQIINHLHFPYLQYIVEWLPFPLTNQSILWLLLLVAIIVFHSTKHKLKLAQIICIGIVTLIALRARRFVSLATFVILPFALKILDKKTYPPILLTLIMVGLSVYVISTNQMNNTLRQSWDTYCQTTEGHCSINMFNQVKNLPPQTKIFNTYRFGGMLIFFDPNHKPYIDGRMHAWEQNGNYPYYNYFVLENTLPGYQSLLIQENFDYALVDPHTALSNTLVKQYGWQVINYQEFITLLRNPQSQY